MGPPRFTPENIIWHMRGAEIERGNGMSVRAGGFFLAQPYDG